MNPHTPGIGHIAGSSIDECCTACQSDEWQQQGCQFFTLSIGSCWFKANNDTVVPSPGKTSGSIFAAPAPPGPGPGPAPAPGTASAGLSFGWTFVIILSCSMVVYVGGGIVYNRKRRGTTGVLDSCPNGAFWRDLPSLVKDGGSFVVDKMRKGRGGGGSGGGGGGKKPTGYQGLDDGAGQEEEEGQGQGGGTGDAASAGGPGGNYGTMG